MAKPKQLCPECATYALGCEKTGPAEFVGHDLVNPRASLWRCKACGARFEVITPAGTMRRITKGTPSPDMCRRVLEFLGISAKLPDFPPPQV